MDCGRSSELLNHLSDDSDPMRALLRTRTDSLLDSLLLEYLSSTRHLFVAMESDEELVLRVGA